MPNPSAVEGVSYDILLISTKTGIVRAVLTEKLESSESLATVKAWDAQVGTSEAVIVDCLHQKFKIGEVFKDYVKGYGYFDKDKKHLNPVFAAHDPGRHDLKGP